MSDKARNFWLERWNIGQIGFHQGGVNSRLQSYWPTLGVEADTNVFVPLCGKSLDMHFLAECGHKVVGVEFSEIAVRAFFDEAGIAYKRTEEGGLPCFEGGAFRLFCGDYFALGAEDLGSIAAVFDRASLIALPPETRTRYAAHMQSLATTAGDMLALTIEYDQEAVTGPPFSVPADELRALYAEGWCVETLHVDTSPQMSPKFNGQTATESVHHLRATS